MGSQLPFKFDSLDQQIDYHVLYAATQFGSGYRHLLHKFAKRVYNSQSRIYLMIRELRIQ